MSEQRNWRPAIEGLCLLVLTLPAALWSGVSLLWLVVPLVVIELQRRSHLTYGLTITGSGPISLHVAVLLGIFLPYAVGHMLLLSGMGATLEPRLPAALGWLVVDHLLWVALPEEMFFRGYLQTQFDQTFSTRWRVLGAEVGLGLFLSAALFAVCHVFSGGGLDRLLTFFPGLLYGWLRARCGNVAVPIVYHALSNVLMRMVLTAAYG